MRRKFNPYFGAAFFFGIIFSLTAMAQAPADSVVADTIAGVVPTSWKPFILLALGIYELVVRLFPTVKNYSIIGWAIKAFQSIIPNKNAGTPTAPHP